MLRMETTGSCVTAGEAPGVRLVTFVSRGHLPPSAEQTQAHCPELPVLEMESLNKMFVDSVEFFLTPTTQLELKKSKPKLLNL